MWPYARRGTIFVNIIRIIEVKPECAVFLVLSSLKTDALNDFPGVPHRVLYSLKKYILNNS